MSKVNKEKSIKTNIWVIKTSNDFLIDTYVEEFSDYNTYVCKVYKIRKDRSCHLCEKEVYDSFWMFSRNFKLLHAKYEDVTEQPFTDINHFLSKEQLKVCKEENLKVR